MKKISLLLSLVGLCVVGSAMADSTSSTQYPIGERSVFSERATIDRIKPIGDVCVEGKPCDAAIAAAAPAAAPAAGGAAGARSGEDVFKSVCTNCHTPGVMGAPKFGNKADWAPHIAKGIDTLHKHALSGFNNMPPRGTCMTCSDAEVMGAVDYMVSHGK